MRSGDHDRTGFPRGALARPLVLLVIGMVASAVLWGILLRDGGSAGQPERLTQHDRAALDRILQRE
jgi:hypothetical protein